MGKWIDYTQVSSVADDDTIMINGKNLATKQALLSELNAKITELESGGSGSSSSGTGWTSSQIDLLDQLFDYLVFADDTQGQSIASQLITSLKNGSSSGGSSSGTDSGGSTTPTTPTQQDYSLAKSVTIDSISTTYGELCIPLSGLDDGMYYYMLDDSTTVASYQRINLDGFFVLKDSKATVQVISRTYNNSDMNGFNPTIEGGTIKITGASLSRFYAGTTYKIYKVGGDA